MDITRCPECGSERIDRPEVDIGVGIQYGPWECYECGWSEGQLYEELFEKIDRDRMKDDPLR